MRRVVHFLTDHNKICQLIMESNRALFSQIMAAFVITNLPINVYLVSQLVHVAGSQRNVNTFEQRYLFYVLISVQSAFFLVAFWPLVAVPERLHEGPRKALLRVQAHLNMNPSDALFYQPKLSLLKLKVDDLVLRLGQGSKVAITIGPAKEVTKETITEVQ